MPVHEVGPDSNGYFYRAVTTAEWSSSYGEQLRAQGYRYCGYGTWGIYVAPAGEPCSYKKDAAPPPPNGGGNPPGPMIQPPADTTGGSGSPPAPVNIPKGCGCGGGGMGPAVPGPTGAPAAPSAPAPTPATMVVDRLRGLPWWVYVLAVVVAAQAVRRG